MANTPKLPKKRHAEFKADAAKLSDTELAKKYKLSERTAYNWRITLVGKRT